MLPSHDNKRISVNDEFLKRPASLKVDSISNRFDNIYVVNQYTQQSPSNYEHLNSAILTKHADVIQHNPYQELNNDVWNDVFPLDRQPIATNVQRLNSDIWKEIFPVNIHSSLDALHEFSSIIDNNDFVRNDNGIQSLDIRTLIDDDDDETIQRSKDTNKLSPSFQIRSSRPSNSSGIVRYPNNLLYDDDLLETKPSNDTFTNSRRRQNSNKIFTDNIDLGADVNDEVFDNPISLKLKKSSVSSLGEVYDTINDYDYIQTGDQRLTADEMSLVQNDNRANRPLPSIPFVHLPLVNANAKNLVRTRTCIWIVAIILLVLIVGGGIAAVVIRFTSEGTRTQGNNETTNVTATTRTNKPEYTLDARSFLYGSSLIKIINGYGKMSGVTVLGSELFIVENRLTKVSVYNTDNFRLTRTIQVTSSLSLAVIVASPQSNCLYISDTGLNAIHRYNLSDNSSMYWTLGTKCYGLSLTGIGNVLVTLFYTRQLVEYTPDGRFIREINLNETLEGPWHSIQLSNNRFFVCHGNDLPLHRVCIVDEVGYIVNCSGGSYGSGSGMYNRPEYMALDSFDNILVSEEYNNRVSLLDSSLNYLDYIHMPSYISLRNPWTLFLDKVKKRLYIGEDSSPGRVLVFSIVQTSS